MQCRHGFDRRETVQRFETLLAAVPGPANATERQLEKWWSPEGEAGTLDDQAIKRRIYAKEFAQMVLFLAADDGAACTAQQFLVDGGRR